MIDVPLTCPLCQATPGQFPVEADRVYGGSEGQRVYVCPNCDVGFLFPGLSAFEEAEFYAREFEKYMGDRAGDQAQWAGPEAHVGANQQQLQRRLPLLEPLLDRPDMHVLEVGCSSGYMLYPLAERGMEVAGIEPSGVFGEYVRSRGISVYQSLEEFARRSPMHGNLDLVMHFFVIEHVKDPAAFLSLCLDALKPGGRMFFELPSRSDPLLTIYDVPAFRDFYWQVAHQWYFNRRSLEVLLNRLPCTYTLIPEQRYDLSNHFWWARYGKPGGTGKLSANLTRELEEAYRDSMCRTGHSDTYFVTMTKTGA